ncbi:dTDP-4-dehydrorhamnose 3,5-epimerase [bacterium]|nr:dTDP-4-dehydrorhamnose 3,5-epimerase [bacterium]
MQFVPLQLKEVCLIKPKQLDDVRGFFLESYHKQRFAENGIFDEFVQDNHSRSAKGVLRGLHFQAAPHGQGKLVRVVRGAVFDVAVDIRKDSPTRGQWVSEVLSEENKYMLYIPPDFAHGFCSLAEDTDVVYKVSEHYFSEYDRGVLWNDPEINIQWPVLDVAYRFSEKDKNNPLLKDI